MLVLLIILYGYSEQNEPHVGHIYISHTGLLVPEVAPVESSFVSLPHPSDVTLLDIFH